MTTEQAKRELLRRYRFLYENAEFILAPYMHKQTQEELEEWNKKYDFDHTEPSVYLDLNICDEQVMSLFEEFLLSDKKCEETKLYQTVKNNKHNKGYLEKVREGLELLKTKDDIFVSSKLDIWNLLRKTSDYIKEQSGDLENKENKLSVIDEYYRVLRYTNDGRIDPEGRYHAKNLGIMPYRLKEDIGVTNNEFIEAIINAPVNANNSIFTEDEKQKVYLRYHNEIPWNLRINCALEEECTSLLVDTRLERPKNTAACGEQFRVIESEIFVNPYDRLYRYFQICPNCGYIVHIPVNLLSNEIKERIEKRCKQDPDLFRRMYLYSELFKLEKKSYRNPKKLLRK